MKLRDIFGHPRAQRWLPARSVFLLLALMAGCASPRPPRPPSLNLPEVVKDLTAQRIGEQVVLHWTTSGKTTDRLDTKGPITAEICRVDHPLSPARPLLPPSRAASSCVPIARVSVHAGASQAADTLPGTLTAGSPAPLAYSIRLLNGSGRSAGLSPQVFAAAGAAPPPVEELRATPAPTGVILQWKPRNTPAAVELDRVLLPAAEAQPSHPASPKTPAKPPVSRKMKASHGSASGPAAISPPPPAEVKLRTPQQLSAHALDPGGVSDTTAAKGDTYRYTAQRVLTASFGGQLIGLRSVPSAPVTVLIRDIFPPAIPTGLEAVPAGAAPADRSIDLSWTPNADNDLAGYFVYRQQVASTGESEGTATRLNQTPVAGPAWSDRTVVTGQRYAYRVTAVDVSGNESKPSAAVQEVFREP